MLEPLTASVAPVAVAAPVAQAQPIVELASPPTNIQPDMVIEMDMDIQPAVELAPAVQPAAPAGQPADWHKRSEKPLMDIHRRLDSMLEEDSASLEERYRERFGDKLPKSVAGGALAKKEEPAAEGKKITFKSRSKISFKPQAPAAVDPEPAAEAEEEPAAAEAPAAEDTSSGDGARRTGSRTKGAIGSGASAVGRGARATGSAIGSGARATGAAIGSGASKFTGLFRRGDSGDAKPAAKKATPKKRAVAKKKAKPDYGAMTGAQLKAELKKQGLPISGKKAELVKRLQKA
ncbi:MAG: hypothetical protein CXT74_03985 [Methanobacteriota archaeon]|nr:MAG: hypothetical protein CXT74_03985 [Euryarchaeota archaeon]